MTMVTPKDEIGLSYRPRVGRRRVKDWYSSPQNECDVGASGTPNCAASASSRLCICELLRTAKQERRHDFDSGTLRGIGCPSGGRDGNGADPGWLRGPGGDHRNVCEYDAQPVDV